MTMVCHVLYCGNSRSQNRLEQLWSACLCRVAWRHRLGRSSAMCATMLSRPVPSSGPFGGTAAIWCPLCWCWWTRRLRGRRCDGLWRWRSTERLASTRGVSLARWFKLTWFDLIWFGLIDPMMCASNRSDRSSCVDLNLSGQMYGDLIGPRIHTSPCHYLDLVG